MFCATCGTSLQGNFCPACGARADQPAAAAVPQPAAVPATDTGLRAGAFLIDVIPAFIAGIVLGWIPILGPMMLGFILCAYWLLRDITGHSLGKIVLGLAVVQKNGASSTQQQRILRNVTIAAGPLLLAIPLGGLFMSPLVAFVIIATETVMLFAKNERIGDMLAGTTVVKTAPQSRSAAA